MLFGTGKFLSPVPILRCRVHALGGLCVEIDLVVVPDIVIVMDIIITQNSVASVGSNLRSLTPIDLF